MTFNQARAYLYKLYPDDRKKLFLMSPRQLWKVYFEIKRRKGL